MVELIKSLANFFVFLDEKSFELRISSMTRKLIILCVSIITTEYSQHSFAKSDAFVNSCNKLTETVIDVEYKKSLTRERLIDMGAYDLLCYNCKNEDACGVIVEDHINTGYLNGAFELSEKTFLKEEYEAKISLIRNNWIQKMSCDEIDKKLAKHVTEILYDEQKFLKQKNQLKYNMILNADIGCFDCISNSACMALTFSLAP